MTKSVFRTVNTVGPKELLPIYVILQDELNRFLRDEKDKLEQLTVNNDFNYIQRFDLKNPELPKLVCQVYADVYDGENKVTDTLIFVSFNNETNIIKVRRQINNLRTPEIHKYREEREKSLIRYVLENKIIEKVIEREYGGKS